MINEDIGLAPFKSKKHKVKKAWMDYNGHMNVAYYTVVFDQAIDEFLEKAIGVGPSFIKEVKQGSYALQTQYRYLRELLLENTVYVSIFVADFTEKNMHLMCQMLDAQDHKICATCETIMVNVDLKHRKSCKYPQAAYEKISALHSASKELRSSTIIGQPIGLRNSSNN